MQMNTRVGIKAGRAGLGELRVSMAPVSPCRLCRSIAVVALGMRRCYMSTDAPQVQGNMKVREKQARDRAAVRQLQ